MKTVSRAQKHDARYSDRNPPIPTQLKQLLPLFESQRAIWLHHGTVNLGTAAA